MDRWDGRKRHPSSKETARKAGNGLQLANTYKMDGVDKKLQVEKIPYTTA